MTATLNRQGIAKVDTAWLRMESPTNLMMITGVMVLADAVDFGQFRDVLVNRLLAFPRFRQKAVQLGSRCFWEDDPYFEVTSHIRRRALPGKADKRELEELVSELASTPLDHSKPLWQFHLIENYVDGPALICRFHHCYADGIALVQVLLSLTDRDPQRSLAPVEAQAWTQRQAEKSNIFKRLAEPARDGFDAVAFYGQQALEEVLGLLQRPDLANHYAEEARQILAELANALLLSQDSPSRFKGPLGVRKQVAWAEPLPLEEVKAVSRALGCTVNDVLIACMTGALHHYLLQRGDDPAGMSMRATVPVNLRPLEHARELGNHFGLVFLDLPVGEDDPLARVYQVSDNMYQLKHSKQAAVSLGLLAVLGMAPLSIQKPALEIFSSKASTVLTNVPGPQYPLYLAGSRLKEQMFWVPQTGSIGMGISILSYDGKVFCGLITDKRLVPDPHTIVDRFAVECENLLHLTMLLGSELDLRTLDCAAALRVWLTEADP